MRRGHAVLVVDLAVGSALVVVGRPVPACQAGFDVNGFGAFERGFSCFRTGFGGGFGSRLRLCTYRRRRRYMGSSGFLVAAAGREQQKDGGREHDDSGAGDQPGFCFLESM